MCLLNSVCKRLVGCLKEARWWQYLALNAVEEIPTYVSTVWFDGAETLAWYTMFGMVHSPGRRHVSTFLQLQPACGIGAVLHLETLLLWTLMVCSKFGQQL